MLELKDELVKILDGLLVHTSITSSSLITEDGLVIAINTPKHEEDEEINTIFAAISASILSMAERGIRIINDNKFLEEIKIDAGVSHNIDEDFTILISRIYSNVLLQVIFPKTTNIGLIHFETDKAINEIKINIKNEDSEELFSSIGSLL